MTGQSDVKMLLCLFALTACTFPDDDPGESPKADSTRSAMADRPTKRQGAGSFIADGATLPLKYIKAFMCDFDENPITTSNRVRQTQRGRAERAGDIIMLKSLGFRRETRDGDLDSVGGKIAAPPSLTVFGLPVRSLEINGMIGDTNALYATTFADGVSAAQVVKAARLEINHASYTKYRIRHYSRRIGENPRIEAYLDDRGQANALLSCQIQATPD